MCSSLIVFFKNAITNNRRANIPNILFILLSVVLESDDINAENNTIRITNKIKYPEKNDFKTGV